MFTLNPQLIFRKEDRCLFDPHNFKLIKLNQAAFEVLELVNNCSVKGEDLYKQAQKFGVQNKAFETFIRKSLQNRVIVETDEQ